VVFPILHKVAPSFQIEEVIFDTFREIVKVRTEHRNPSMKCKDLADFLVDCSSNLSSSEFKRLGITETTLLAQALNVTALDMISATMTMISYFLAQNPEVQKKLHEEIDLIIVEKYEGRIDAQTIHELPYLQACLDETLRLAPPLIRPERICTKDWVSPDGSLKIKKGTVVMIPLWAAHRNPKYFPNPEKFDPERFLSYSETYNDNEKHPYAYSPFGLGPRNCIGMRLAIETLKANVCVLLKHYKIQSRPDTHLQFKPGGLFLLQFRPLYLDLLSRESNNDIF
jgi:cytochrome P450